MSEDARKYASELRDIAGMVAQTEDGPLRWKQYRLAAIADYLSAYQSEAPAQGEETWASIAEWCEATFGPCTPYRIVSRAAEEMKELAEETLIDFDWSDKAREEVADVLICLSRVPDIWKAVEGKMAINRAREWRIMGDGTGYHVRAGNEPPTPAPVRGE